MKSLLCCCHHNLWNSLLDHLRQAKLVDNFKSLLKDLFLSKLFMHKFYIHIFCLILWLYMFIIFIFCVFKWFFVWKHHWTYGFWHFILNHLILILLLSSHRILIFWIILEKKKKMAVCVSFLTKVTQEAAKIKNKNIHVFLTLSLNKGLCINTSSPLMATSPLATYLQMASLFCFDRQSILLKQPPNGKGH